MIARFPDRHVAARRGYRPMLASSNSRTTTVCPLRPRLRALPDGSPALGGAEYRDHVTSDHGEALFDRGYGNHGTGLFDDEVASRWLRASPAPAPRRHRVMPVGLIDIMPSLCTYLGISARPHVRRQLHRRRRPRAGTGARYIVTEGVVGGPVTAPFATGVQAALGNGPLGDGKVEAEPLLALRCGARPEGAPRPAARKEPDRRRTASSRPLSAALRDAVPDFATPNHDRARRRREPRAPARARLLRLSGCPPRRHHAVAAQAHGGDRAPRLYLFNPGVDLSVIAGGLTFLLFPALHGHLRALDVATFLVLLFF